MAKCKKKKKKKKKKEEEEEGMTITSKDRGGADHYTMYSLQVVCNRKLLSDQRANAFFPPLSALKKQ